MKETSWELPQHPATPGETETPAVPDGKSFLQQGGDLCLPGDFYMDELQQSDCQEGLESPGQWLVWQQWLGGERRLQDKPVVPPPTPAWPCHPCPPPRWPGCAHAP